MRGSSALLDDFAQQLFCLLPDHDRYTIAALSAGDNNTKLITNANWETIAQVDELAWRAREDFFAAMSNTCLMCNSSSRLGGMSKMNV